MRRIKFVVPILLAFLIGCAMLQSIGITSKPYSEMTSQEKVLYALKTYNAQYADYVEMSAKVNLTEGQKQVLRIKKQVLTELWPLIDSAKKSVDGGQLLSSDLALKINALINQLITKM